VRRRKPSTRAMRFPCFGHQPSVAGFAQRFESNQRPSDGSNSDMSKLPAMRRGWATLRAGNYQRPHADLRWRRQIRALTHVQRVVMRLRTRIDERGEH
jgi:hypothetical protein